MGSLEVSVFSCRGKMRRGEQQRKPLLAAARGGGWPLRSQRGGAWLGDRSFIQGDRSLDMLAAFRQRGGLEDQTCSLICLSWLRSVK